MPAAHIMRLLLSRNTNWSALLCQADPTLQVGNNAAASYKDCACVEKHPPTPKAAKGPPTCQTRALHARDSENQTANPKIRTGAFDRDASC